MYDSANPTQDPPSHEQPRSAGLEVLLKNDPAYAKKYAQLVVDVETLSRSELREKYQAEYYSWANRKHCAKKSAVYFAECMTEFRDFLRVNGPIPHESWTLDRIYPTGGYEPKNVRWASKTTQSQNRTNSMKVALNGATYTLTQAANLARMDYDAVRMGIRRGGVTYLTKLAEKTVSAGVEIEELQWQFPEEARAALEVEYEKRSDPNLNRLRFFTRFMYKALCSLKHSLSFPMSADEREKLEAELEEVRKLRNEAARYFNNLQLGAYYRRKYGHINVDPSPLLDHEDYELFNAGNDGPGPGFGPDEYTGPYLAML